MNLKALALVALSIFLHTVAVLAQGVSSTARDQKFGGGSQMVPTGEVTRASPTDSVTGGQVTLANGTTVGFKAVAGFPTTKMPKSALTAATCPERFRSLILPRI